MHSPRTRAKPPMQPLAVSATPCPPIGEKITKSQSRFSEDENPKTNPTSSILSRRTTVKSNPSMRSVSMTSTHSNLTVNANPRSTSPAGRISSAGGRRGPRAIPAPDPIITISGSGENDKDKDGGGGLFGSGHIQGQAGGPSSSHGHARSSHVPSTTTSSFHSALDDDLEYVTVEHPADEPDLAHAVVHARTDKAARILGLRHQSMEPIPGSNRNSVASARSAPPVSVSAPPPSQSGPTLPLASLYVVSGLPKSPQTWTLADPDSVMGLHHSEGAVGRWWRPEVLGSTISPGAGGGGKRKKKNKAEETSTVFSSSGHMNKQEVGKMLSKALKVRLSLFPLARALPVRLRLNAVLSLMATDRPRSSRLRARSKSLRRLSSRRRRCTTLRSRCPRRRRRWRRARRRTCCAPRS